MGNNWCCQGNQNNIEDPRGRQNTRRLTKKQRKALQKARKNGEGPDAETLYNLYYQKEDSEAGLDKNGDKKIN